MHLKKTRENRKKKRSNSMPSMSLTDQQADKLIRDGHCQHHMQMA